MFNINDYVVYNSSGVYKVVDITKEMDINNNETEYYVLEPAFTNNLTIKTPVNNRKVLMREVMSKDEVLALIASMPEMENIWINDARERNGNFKEALRSGESERWAELLKTLYEEQQEKSEIGKKLMKLDEEIMKAAEKNINEEFAIALNISPDEVSSFILERLS